MSIPRLSSKYKNNRKCQIMLHAFFLICSVGGACSLDRGNESYTKTVLQMPVVPVAEQDTYLCMEFALNDLKDEDLIGYEFQATPNIVHHVTAAACEDFATHKNVWECKKESGSMCRGRSVQFQGWDGWSKRHRKIIFPADVAVRLGAMWKLNTIILQTHFKDQLLDLSALRSYPINLTLYTTRERRPYSFQEITSYVYGYIPPYQSAFQTETACSWSRPAVQLYQYSIHTHNYGILVEGYLIRNNSAIMLGRASPQTKHSDTFDIPYGPIELRHGDKLVSRCTYRNTGGVRVMFGTGGADEMCTFGLIFKYRMEDGELFNKPFRCEGLAQKPSWCPSKDPSNVLCYL